VCENSPNLCPTIGKVTSKVENNFPLCIKNIKPTQLGVYIRTSRNNNWFFFFFDKIFKTGPFHLDLETLILNFSSFFMLGGLTPRS